MEEILFSMCQNYAKAYIRRGKFEFKYLKHELLTGVHTDVQRSFESLCITLLKEFDSECFCSNRNISMDANEIRVRLAIKAHWNRNTVTYMCLIKVMLTLFNS